MRCKICEHEKPVKKFADVKRKICDECKNYLSVDDGRIRDAVDSAIKDIHFDVTVW